MIDVFLKGGFLMYPILLCSVAGLAIIINKAVQYRGVFGAIEQPLDEVLKTRPPILQPILEGLEQNCNEQELSVVGTKQVREIEKGLSWLGLIATITPLLGLTGTVLGMIKAFMVIARSEERRVGEELRSRWAPEP